MEYPEISIVIGSWGSYNSCNERALGSEWLNLADFESWEEIEEELKKQGFQLKGIDEELFIQDIDGIPSSGTNWDGRFAENICFLILSERNLRRHSIRLIMKICFL